MSSGLLKREFKGASGDKRVLLAVDERLGTSALGVRSADVNSTSDDRVSRTSPYLPHFWARGVMNVKAMLRQVR